MFFFIHQSALSALSTDRTHRISLVEVMVYGCLLCLSLLSSFVHSFPQSQSNGRVSFGSILQNGNGGITLNNNGEDGIVSRNPDWQYWCDTCACGFNKRKSYQEHLDGKRHDITTAASERLWNEYQLSGPAFYDPSVSSLTAWSLDLFMNGLPARSRSSIKFTINGSKDKGSKGGQLDPSLRLCHLSPIKRAALWRYLTTCSSNLAELANMVAALPPRYVRVKELLESVETFTHIERLMKRSTVHGEKARKLSHIYDVGCGHGLVGMLCAAAFPHISVHAIDRVPRDSFEAQRLAFKSAGVALDNLTFETGDLDSLRGRQQDDDNNDASTTSLLLCVHGCKSLTHESIELAKASQWAWLVLPCCLQSENHLSSTTTLSKVPDGTRFAMLCGAMTAKYEPETVSLIDARITARGIVLASSGRL